MTTLLDLFQKTASAHPERPAVFYGPNKISYQALSDQSVAVAQKLRGQMGVQPGDHVAILLKNCPEYIPCLYGVFQAGAAAVPMNNFLKFPEIEFILRDSGAQVLITSDDFKDMLPRFHASLPELKILKVVDLPPVSTLEQFDLAPLSPSSLAAIVYTSGTTGKPKGAMLTQHNLASNVLSCQKLLQANPRDRFTLMLPMFHSFMLTVCIFTPLSMGASIILVRSLQPFKPVLQEFIKRRATILIGIPQIFQAMANAKIPFWIHWLLNFRLAVSGSAPLSMETLQNFAGKFRFPLCEGYGLSEAAPVVSFNPIRGVRKQGTVGVPIANVKVAILDEEDHEL